MEGRLHHPTAAEGRLMRLGPELLRDLPNCLDDDAWGITVPTRRARPMLRATLEFASTFWTTTTAC